MNEVFEVVCPRLTYFSKQPNFLKSRIFKAMRRILEPKVNLTNVDQPETQKNMDQAMGRLLARVKWLLLLRSKVLGLNYIYSTWRVIPIEKRKIIVIN